MRLNIRSARPILLGIATTGAIVLMGMGLVMQGTAEVVPVWFQGLIAGGFVWFFRDRTKERDEKVKAQGEAMEIAEAKAGINA